MKAGVRPNTHAYVTALFDLSELETPGFRRRRSMAAYMELLSELLELVRCPIHVFTSRTIHRELKVTELEGVQWHFAEAEDILDATLMTEVAKACERGRTFPRNAAKDTPAFIVLQYMKMNFLMQALASETDLESLTWVDAGILHLIQSCGLSDTKAELAKRLVRIHERLERYPTKEVVLARMHDATASTRHETRYPYLTCGGLFTVPAGSAMFLQDKTSSVLEDALREKGIVHSEETALGLVRRDYLQLFRTYDATHADMIKNRDELGVDIPARTGESGMKPHEAWWEKNFDTQGETFRNWIGNEDAPSRRYLQGYVSAKQLSKVLECGAGLCIDAPLVTAAGAAYAGIDITPKLVAEAKAKAFDVELGSIEDIPKPDESYDLVYCRHVLEHLSSFQTALDEMLRIAKREVLVVFFLPPVESTTRIDLHQEMHVYHNVYDRREIDKHLDKYVRRWVWVGKELVLHVESP